MTKAEVVPADRLLDIEKKYGEPTTYADGSLLDDIHWLIEEAKRLRTHYKLQRRALRIYNDAREAQVNLELQQEKLGETFCKKATVLQEEATAAGLTIWDSIGQPPPETTP